MEGGLREQKEEENFWRMDVGSWEVSVIKADSSGLWSCHENMLLLHCADVETEMFRGLHENTPRVEYYFCQSFDDKITDFLWGSSLRNIFWYILILNLCWMTYSSIRLQKHDCVWLLFRGLGSFNSAVTDIIHSELTAPIHHTQMEGYWIG